MTLSPMDRAFLEAVAASENARSGFREWAPEIRALVEADVISPEFADQHVDLALILVGFVARIAGNPTVREMFEANDRTRFVEGVRADWLQREFASYLWDLKEAQTVKGNRTMTDKKNPHGVKVGQVWADNDKRSRGRRVTVLEVGDEKALVTTGFKKTWIRLTRFRPNSTGYRLVSDVGVRRD